MNEEVMNMSIRKFLKKVGVNSQREIEKALDHADSEGRLSDRKPIKVKMTLECDQLPAPLVIEDEIHF